MYIHHAAADIHANGNFTAAFNEVAVEFGFTLHVSDAEWGVLNFALDAMGDAAQEIVLGSHYDEDAGVFVTGVAELTSLEIGLRVAVAGMARNVRTALNAAYSGGRFMAADDLGLDEAREALAERPTGLRVRIPGRDDESIVVLRPDVAMTLRALHTVFYPLDLHGRFVKIRARALIDDARDEYRNDPVPTVDEARKAAEAEWEERGLDKTLRTLTEKLAGIND